MGEPLRLVGIGGSMRVASRSLTALARAAGHATALGCAADVFDVRRLDLPVYRPDWTLERYPASLAAMLTAVRAANIVLFSAPTYHGTVSGAVKNAIDALDFLVNDDPPYLTGRVVGLIGVGGGATHVLDALAHAARAFDAVVVPTYVGVPGDAIDDAGRIDDHIDQRLQRMVAAAIALAHRISPSGRPSLHSEVP